MDGSLIVAAQLSSLFPPYQATSIVLSTRQEGVPLPTDSTSRDSPPEHASYSSFFSSTLTGTIVFRLIHGGLILELLSITHEISSVRIVFPSTVLPSPSVSLWQDRELHILAFTTTGSLFRVVLPIHDGAHLWEHTSSPGSYWFREYVINKFKPGVAKIVQAQSAHSVAIGLTDGSLVRLETRDMGEGSDNDQWDEAISSPTSRFTSLTSFLHTNVADVWTLSRDRTLRMWTVSGRVSEKVLSTVPSSGRTASPSPGAAASAAGALLQAQPQRLLHAFIPSWSYSAHVLVFVPAGSSSNAAGSFHLFDTAGDALQARAVVECPSNNGHAHLQDFTVVGGTLYSLWERGGQTVVEACGLQPSGDAKPVWQVATYPQEAELTPAYLDELLLSPGSLTDRYFEAVMRPGMFSPFTLQTALAQYIDSCLSHPSTAHSRPPQLLTTYASLAESITAIVGCTVQLGQEPKTGAQQYDKYWNALKRDWEGFIARCREIERSARWPLTVGFDPLKGVLLVIERERIGMVTVEDLPLQMYRLLSTTQSVQPQYNFLEILWTIRTRLGRRVMLSLESRLIDIAHQEIAFPYADIIQDQARRSNFVDELDEGVPEWITGRLQNVDNIDAATRMVLDVVGGCDQAVKREEDDTALLLPPPVEWTKLLTVSYVTNSVEARYDLCLCLIALLFFLSEDLQQWDPSLLSEIFVVFRGVAMLRHAARLPGGDKKISDPEQEEDVVAKMRNMNVSTVRTAYRPVGSLLNHLLTSAIPGVTVPESAHRYLDGSGLLQSIDPAHATKSEVEFCNTLRTLGSCEATRDALSWLPRTPGVCYVRALSWIDEGRYEDAAPALQSLSSCFDEGRAALTEEDRDALASVLPRQELFDSDFSFYLHVAGLFRESSVTTFEVAFTQLAISVAPVVNTMPLWSTVIKGLTEVGLYDDAYKALISSPYEKLKQDCVPSLVYRMCEEHAVDRLIGFNFVGLNDEVEDCLSFKARNAEPRVRPFYSMILYTWYISRNDYRSAALIMYQRARKLAGFTSDPADFHALADLQLEAYAVSINALSLVDPNSAWFVLPAVEGSDREPRKRQKVTRFIPEEKFADRSREVEVVELSDIKHEYSLLVAQVELIRLQPQFLFVSEVLTRPLSVVLKLAQFNLFDTALAAGEALGVDMTDVFAHLTNQCLRFSQSPTSLMMEDMSDWLLTDKVSSWTGTSADRAWRYLRQALDHYDGPQSDYAYSKVALETILAFERTSPPPPWLVQILATHHPEHLIRSCLRYDVLDYALEYVIDLISKNSLNAVGRTASATWLPYTLIDQVMMAAETQSDLSTHGQTLRSQLRVELSNRLKRVQKMNAIPIYAVVGVVLAGGGWYLVRLARGPTVVWTKDNPTPWNDIKPNEGTKILTVNQHFEKGYGINAFDTSAYYGPSEIVLGTALKAIEPEFPRSSYTLMTKCGRYGLTKAEFDYSPVTIRASVNRSLSRLNTTYLDAVYLHDTEFVCEQVQPRSIGNHVLALTTESAEYGLAPGEEAKIRGPGDQIVLDAVAELRKMKTEGLVKNIGITGFPLHTLLRIAILVLHTAPFEPLDILLSYSHLHIQDDTFADFLPQLRERARVAQFIAASPLNMGLLTPAPPPWHPAQEHIHGLAQKAGAFCVEQGWEGGLPNVALGYSYRKANELGVPMVVGLSQIREVKETVKVWRGLKEQDAKEVEKRLAVETAVKASFGDAFGSSWASP
ncbi:hypothetical protein EUX98_g479 [Antrodiella citrinella]|uniref:Uncharacterized protein n=1 Tax=Antrodiella citrinella TaxID=2447956 RepID=A0A4S4N6W0_9APHY|nr:hypothetical protein EUX98_g479 [Antrodiella citrinella]